MYETDITKDAGSPFTNAGSGPKLTSDSSIVMTGCDKKIGIEYCMLNIFDKVYHQELQKTICKWWGQTPNCFWLVFKMAVEDSVVWNM